MYLLWMIFHLFFVFLPVFAGMIVFRNLERPLQWFWLYVCWELVTECFAYYFAFAKKGNAVVYTISGPVQLLLLATYYQSYVPLLKRWRIALIVGSAATVAAILNTTYFQPFGEFPGNFVLLQAVTSIFLAIAGIRACIEFKREGFKSFFPHFYLAAVFLSRWLLLGVELSFYSEIAAVFGRENWIINHSLQIISAITGMIVTIIFLAYSKIESYARA